MDKINAKVLKMPDEALVVLEDCNNDKALDDALQILKTNFPNKKIVVVGGKTKVYDMARVDKE